jgi:large subunit ribosomal protein L35
VRDVRARGDPQVIVLAAERGHRGESLGALSIIRAFMPKMKSHSGSKKRFKVTAGGKVRGRHAFSSHILEKKSPKRKRRFSKPVELSKPDAKRAIKLLGGHGR